jgi:hypothetical protein
MTDRASSSVGGAPSRAGRNRAGVVATGLALLAQLGIARAVLTADREHAYFLGRPVGLVCGFHAHFGVPCPACGVTRGVALALRGDLAGAWHVFPIAPLAVFGVAVLAMVLLAFAALASSRLDPWAPRAKRWLLAASLT